LIGAAATAQDGKMGETVSGYWVQFAKTANPNRTGSPEWPAYTRESDRLLESGAAISVREHFRAERLNLIDTAMGRR
jgi:para-nitrobenzyl esterase